MQKKTATATVETAFGKPQPKDKQNYSYDYRVFESGEEAVNAGFNFIDLANAAEKSNERSKAYNAAIEWAKPDPNAPETVKDRMIKDAMKLGKTKEQATALVESLLA